MHTGFQRFAWLPVAAATVLLAACGGGGGGSNSTPTGVVNLAITDGPSDDFDHVWVTVKSVSFHTSTDQVWNAADATWQTYTLPAPVAIDLTALNNGALNQQLFNGINLPTGSYKQIRLFFAAYDDALTASAQAAGLQWNDEVQYTDSTGTGHNVPLEMAYPVQGIQLVGSFTVSAGSALNLAVDFDLAHDVVKYRHGNEFLFTMKPNLRYFDLDQSGAIVGHIDTANLCQGASHSNCGYNLVVKAETLTPDGTRHYDLRATTVKSDGSFTLFPLPAGTSYDVLIRGRNLETDLIQNVPVVAGTTPSSGATVVSSGVVPAVLASGGEYFANFNTPLAPSSGWAIFQQTLPGTGQAPYEVRWRNTNPYTGVFEDPIALSNGPLHVATYAANSAATFSSVTPQEGDGGYSVATNGLVYYARSSNVAIASPGTNTASSPLLFAENMPSLVSGVTAGSVGGNIQLSNTTRASYDRGYLVFVRFANIMQVTDVSSLIAGGGGSYQVTLPAGSSASPVPGAYYYAYLRLWNSAAPLLTMRVVPVNGFADLRTANAVTGYNVSY